MGLTRVRVFSIVALSVGLAAVGVQPSVKAQSAGSLRAPRVARTSEYAPDELIVRFRHDASASARNSRHRQHGATASKRLNLVDDLYRVRLPKGANPLAISALYRRHPEVVYAEPNWIVTSLDTPNDPSLDSLWGLHNTGQAGGVPDADIDAPEAWTITHGEGTGVVAIIDTGVDYAHPDLAQNMFHNPGDCTKDGIDDDLNGYVDDCHGISVLNDDGNPMDDYGHGTHVAGTIGAAGNNSRGVVGVNWSTQIMACKFLDSNGSGTIAGAIECMNYVSMMKDRGANIIATNNSWGGGDYSQALYDAIESHRQRGILFVAAAGNSALDTDVTPMYPAAYYLPNIISVAATDRFDGLAYFSNFGRHTTHLGAPGQDILSTTPNDTYDTFSGTSMAAPHVTGVAALLSAQDPSRSAAAIKNLILAGADPNTNTAGTTISGNRLNAYGALTCANSVVAGRLRPTASAIENIPGVPVNLAALNINCSLPNGDVTVTVPETSEAITLRDDGLGTDQGALDGIYSGQWISPASGTYTLIFPGGDAVTVKDALVDLTETALVEPAGGLLGPGRYFSVTDTTLNQGLGSSVPSMTSYYLSTDAGWDTADALLSGSRYVPGLSANTSSTGTVNVTVPSATALGTYYLLACADGAQQVAESDETNNCMASGTTVQVALPDLVVSELSNPPSVIGRGTSFSVTDTTLDQGSAAYPSTTRYYLSTDQTWGSADTPFTTTRLVASLSANASSRGTTTVSVPSTTSLGTYYLLACADDTKQVAESDETNNCRPSATTALLALPDLTISALANPPSVGVPGGTFSAVDTTLNQGTGDASSSITRFYLSTDTAQDAADKLLSGTRIVSSLTVNASSSGTVTVTIPSTVVSGTYYLLACGDDTKLVSESDEINNCKASGTTLVITPSDLVVSALSNPPVSIGPGVGFSVTDTTANQGAGSSIASITRYYLSVDTVWGTSDRLLTGTRSLASLAPNTSSPGAVTVTVPTATALNTYYLLACADDTKLVSESDETNNCLASTTTVQVARSDLVVSALNDPQSAVGQGGTLPVTDTTLNQGVGSSSASGTRYYLSTDTVWGTTDKLLTGTRAIATLDAGASSAGTVTVTVPTTTTLGTYYLIACADDTKIVAESVETNNCKTSVATVQVMLADLVVSTISNPPGSAARGGRFSVTDTTVNQGAVSVASVNRYYLSADAFWDAADALLTGTRSVPILAMNASSTGTLTVTVPSVIGSGSYYLLACADDTKKVTESNEANNCRASMGKVNIP